MKNKKYGIKKRRTNIMPFIISIASRDLDVELYNLHEELGRGNITANKCMSEYRKINSEYRNVRIV